MLDEQKQASMVARKRCKSLQEILARRPREEAQKAIIVLNTALGEDLIALGVTNRIVLIVTAKRMSINHNLF